VVLTIFKNEDGILLGEPTNPGFGDRHSCETENKYSKISHRSNTCLRTYSPVLADDKNDVRGWLCFLSGGCCAISVPAAPAAALSLVLPPTACCVVLLCCFLIAIPIERERAPIKIDLHYKLLPIARTGSC
jgi:hypothetical protein